IIPRPFSYDNSVYLDAGMHIHFVLPSYFKKFDDKGNLPKAPNRWYINREKDGKEWIVESDHIWNINDPELNKSQTCTYVEEAENNFHFKYIGRKYRLEDWVNKGNSKDNYLNNLSALGWGSFSFDIHYPNCRSVFGFYDEEGTENDAYTIIGWVETYAQNIVNENIVAGKFQLKPNAANENEGSFDIAIANTLPETLSALIINTNNPTLSKQDLQKQEEQIASMINFDELKGLNLDWISRLRNKQHEQQFNKTAGTTKYVLNIVDADHEDSVQEYDFDINLLDFEPSKSIADQYENIREKLNILNESALSDEIILPVFGGINLSELTNISFNASLEDELDSLNRLLNNCELETFRLHTKIESLYLHWSAYLGALFLNKNRNINKLKDDLALLISQINILKKKIKNAEANVAKLQLLFSEKISGYYKKYRDYAIVNFLVKAQHSGDAVSQKELQKLLDLRYKTQIILSKKSRTDYYNALPPSIIISSPKKNTIFNLFTNPSVRTDERVFADIRRYCFI
ncbi:coiled-coil domain-containing protein, partial [Chryseobacterium sp. 2TAF14]|uniref:coiled-coil domain-containing protein n=1 Tax=Chryseobacterium sp. 2TAF14 TaxID=3233007 RepID=UPI003F905A44